MRKMIIIMSIILLNVQLFSQNKHKATKSQLPKVVVYYFHGTHRCAGCLGAEAASKKAIDELYPAELSKGVIRFESLNLEEPQNKALVEKYKIGWSTLLLVKQGKTEEKVDLTDDAFSLGRSNPEKLKGIIKATVDKMLK